MPLLDWLIVLLFNGAIIGYGFYLARGTKSSSDWFLGRRALPWWGIGLSMFATNIDNADLVSVTGETFNTGMHIITVFALGSAVGGILAGFFVTPAMYRAGYYTNAEYLESRFGVTTRILSALIQIQYRSSMLGLMMYTIFLLLTRLGIVGPVPAWFLIVGMVVFAGIYTAFGGLKSVVWTDAMQAVVMMIGAVVIFCTIWLEVGGWSGMKASLARQETQQQIAADTLPPSTMGLLASTSGNGPLPAISAMYPGREWPVQLTKLPHIGGYDGGDERTSPYVVAFAGDALNLGPFIVVIGWTIVASGYFTVNHTQTMRLMGARSLWDMKMAAVAGVLLSLPIMIGSISLGIFGRALPEFQGMQQPPTADTVYPDLVGKYLSVGLKGLVVAGVFAAAISTFDSMGSALSAVFTRDIYARLIFRRGDDRHYVLVGRLATVGVLLLGFAYLPFIFLQRNMLNAFTTLIPVFVTPLFTIYLAGVLTRAHPRSGLIGLICGSLYGVFALYCREAPKIDFLPDVTWAPLWLTDRWGALCFSLLITASAMLCATLLLGRRHKSQQTTVHQTGWLERSREALPPLKEHPFSQTPSWWLNPWLYAVLILVVTTYVVFGLFW